MANNRFRYEGLEELRADLRKLPRDLRDEGGEIVTRKANLGGSLARDGYASHRHSGNLAEGVRVEILSSSERIASAVVKNVAPHAFIFENGTEVRYTKFGAFRGQMPPGNVFIPAMVRARREMFDELRGLLRSKGLTVIG